MRAGLLEVVPAEALALLSPASATTLWDGSVGSPASVRARCRVIHARATRPPHEPSLAAHGAAYDPSAYEAAMRRVADGEDAESDGGWSDGSGVEALLEGGMLAAAREAEATFWQAVALLAGQEGSSCGADAAGAGAPGAAGRSGDSWLVGLLCFWTGIGRLPVGDGDAHDALEAALDRQGGRGGLGGLGGGLGFGPPDGGNGSGGDDASRDSAPPSATWLTLRVEVADPARPRPSCRPLPRAQTCTRRLDVVAWPGETAKDLAAVLRTAIAHGSAGFAFM